MLNAIKTKASNFCSGVMPLRSLRKRADGEESLTGLCAGLAYWLGVPEWCVCAAVIGLSVWSVATVAVYVVVSIVLPSWNELPENFDQRIGRLDRAAP